MAGEPERVHAERVLAPSGVDVRLLALLGFPGDVTAAIDCAFDLPPRSRLEIAGSEGTLTLDDPWHGRRGSIALQREGGLETVEVDRADPYRLQLEDFAAAVRETRPPCSTETSSSPRPGPSRPCSRRRPRPRPGAGAGRGARAR